MLAEEIRFCPRCGARLESGVRFGKERPICPACAWIFFADPKVAVAVLVEQDGRVLLVRRANEPHRGEWTLPAGFMDAGEDPARAAERECLEETGLNIRVTALIDIIAGQEHTRGAHLVIAYRGEIVAGALNAADDADEADFFEWGKFPPLAFEATRRILSAATPLH